MYGVPSAGVLCVELLKASKSPDSDRQVIPRAEVIQKLSIFVSCLEWARSSGKTYTLCGHMYEIISHIMEQVLSNNVPLERHSVTVDRVLDVPLNPPTVEIRTGLSGSVLLTGRKATGPTLADVD